MELMKLTSSEWNVLSCLWERSLQCFPDQAEGREEP